MSWDRFKYIYIYIWKYENIFEIWQYIVKESIRQDNAFTKGADIESRYNKKE